MKWTHWMCALALSASLVGCGGNEEEAQAEAEEAAGELANALDEAMDEAAEETDEAADEAAEAAAATGNEGAEAAQKGLAALGEALQAAQNAEGSTPCEQSWNGMQAMIAAMTKNGAGEPEGEMPSQEQFMEACGNLSEQAQQCMVPSYAMQHMQECNSEEIRNEMQSVREMMNPSSDG